MEWALIIFVLFFAFVQYNLTARNGKKTSFALKMEELFGADLRSLALFRIAFALVVIKDLIARASDLQAFYTDEGLFPRALAVQLNDRWYYSFHLLSGKIEIQAILFALAGIFAFCMLIGYKTRAAVFLSWLLVVSLQNRDIAANNAGDWLFRLVHFWSIFLPLGACYSVDSALNSSREKLPKRILSFGTVGFFAQVCFMYWFSVPLKLQNVEWRDGTAVFYALNILPDVTLIGQQIAKLNIEILKLMNFSVLKFEVFGPLLLFSPIFTVPARLIAMLGFGLLHIGFASSLHLEFFPYVAMSSMLAFLPSDLWDKFLPRLKTSKRLGLKIYYDGQCGFCKKMVLILRTFFLIPETQILPAQDDSEIYKIMEGNNSWVIVDHSGERHIKFNGWIALCSSSPLLFPLVPIFQLSLVRDLGNSIYETIAKRRKFGSKITSLFNYQTVNVIPTKYENALAAFFFAYVFAWNLWMVEPKMKFPNKLAWIGSFLRLDQKWSMFVAATTWHSGWPVFPGKLKDGTEVDLFTKKEGIDWEKPALSSAMYKNRYWKRYVINTLTEPNFKANYPFYASYLCKEWNKNHKGDKQLEQVDLYFVVWSPQPKFKFAETGRLFRWREYCIEKTAKPDEVINDLETRFTDKTKFLTELYLTAYHYLSKGKYIDAEALYKKAIETQEEISGKDSPQILEALGILSTIYSALDKYKELEELSNRINKITLKAATQIEEEKKNDNSIFSKCGGAN